jgi:hypothetical protein
MISQSLIIALIVLAIHYTMQEGEIFSALGRFFERNLPHKIHPALFECNVCMTPWYGSVTYIAVWGINWQWPVVVIAAMGFNIVINKWAAKDQQINYHQEINSGVMLTPSESKEEKVFEFNPNRIEDVEKRMY